MPRLGCVRCETEHGSGGRKCPAFCPSNVHTRLLIEFLEDSPFETHFGSENTFSEQRNLESSINIYGGAGSVGILLSTCLNSMRCYRNCHKFEQCANFRHTPLSFPFNVNQRRNKHRCGSGSAEARVRLSWQVEAYKGQLNGRGFRHLLESTVAGPSQQRHPAIGGVSFRLMLEKSGEECGE